MEKTSRAIIFNDKGQLITIKRTKYKLDNIINEYYTLPGGHVEENETYEETLKREIYEELGVSIEISKKIIEINNTDLNRQEVFFECEIIDGIIGSGTGPEWTNIDRNKYGLYEIKCLDIKDIKDIKLLPDIIKCEILERYK